MMLAPWKESYDKPREHIKKQRHYFANKGPSSQGYGFPSGRVWMWELDHKAGWVPKNWCFWTVVLEKTLQSPLDCKIKPINSKTNQPGLVTGRANAEAPILWPPDVKSQVIGKDLMLGKMEGKRRKWHKRWNGQIPSPTQRIRIWTNSGRQWRTGEPGMLHAVHGVTKSWTQLSNWTTTTKEK